ncbi:MAG TPA: hypothetical protein VFB06_11335 [Streptosporangiaceae bacterium]|nr:hypothetical protein [Streptosporangiaceae bacterium]
MADTDPPPAFSFDGSWPFTGTPEVSGHPVATVTAFTVQAAPDGIPAVTLTLVGPDALRLALAPGAARVQVSDQTREALISLGWTPPSER